MTTIASPTTIGLRLYRLRAERGWSGRTVATKLGVNHVSYYNWEWGKYRIPLERAIQLADLYGVSVESIFGENERSE